MLILSLDTPKCRFRMMMHKLYEIIINSINSIQLIKFN